MPVREYVDAIVLGIVQGITEFLPISSDGHLVIAQALLHGPGETDKVALFQTEVALHLGTLLAIVVVYWSDLVRLLKQPRLCLAIVVATIPAVAAGLTLKKWIESETQTPLWAGCGLLVTAAALAIATFFERRDTTKTDVSLATALWMGIGQSVAILPGVSRSGTTISTGLVSGLGRETAATFSFLMAVPVVAGAILLTAKDAWETGTPIKSYGALAVGIAVSFIVGWLALNWLLRIVKRGKLHYFAWYCALAGTAVIVWQVS
jgi:undecaprenyl-diphosphatase